MGTVYGKLSDKLEGFLSFCRNDTYDVCAYRHIRQRENMSLAATGHLVSGSIVKRCHAVTAIDEEMLPLDVDVHFNGIGIHTLNPYLIVIGKQECRRFTYTISEVNDYTADNNFTVVTAGPGVRQTAIRLPILVSKASPQRMKSSRNTISSSGVYMKYLFSSEAVW